jgi:hypothetical protein
VCKASYGKFNVQFLTSIFQLPYQWLDGEWIQTAQGVKRRGALSSSALPTHACQGSCCALISFPVKLSDSSDWRHLDHLAAHQLTAPVSLAKSPEILSY